jgi:hypothetical protein
MPITHPPYHQRHIYLQAVICNLCRHNITHITLSTRRKILLTTAHILVRAIHHIDDAKTPSRSSSTAFDVVIRRHRGECLIATGAAD